MYLSRRTLTVHSGRLLCSLTVIRKKNTHTNFSSHTRHLIDAEALLAAELLVLLWALWCFCSLCLLSSVSSDSALEEEEATEALSSSSRPLSSHGTRQASQSTTRVTHRTPSSTRQKHRHRTMAMPTSHTRQPTTRHSVYFTGLPSIQLDTFFCLLFVH